MKIAENKFVKINYTLKDDDGNVVDSSLGKDREPLPFVFGRGELISGLEKELEGKKAGDKFNCTIPPAEAYGEYDEGLVFDVPLTEFDTDATSVEVGMAFYAQTEMGPRVVHVLNVTKDTVKLDGNHELAGKSLHFEVEVVEVRDATETELNPPQGCGGGCGGCSGGGCGSGGCGSGGCGSEGCGCN